MTTQVAVRTTPEEQARRALAAVDTGERVLRHVLTEFTNDIDQIIATVAPGPVVYGVAGADEAGRPVLEAAHDHVGARQHYEHVRDSADILEWRPYTEIRNDWFVFFEGIVTMKLVATGEDIKQQSIVLFPMGTDDGILGELAWSSHVGRQVAPADTKPEAPPLIRVDNLDLHTRFVEGLRSADVNAVLATMDDRVAVSLRNYVAGGPYGVCSGRDAVAGYYRELFGAFEIEAIDVVNIVIGDWFIFSELLWTVRPRQGEHAGSTVRCCTAAMMPLDANGRMIAQVGYGTDLSAV